MKLLRSVIGLSSLIVILFSLQVNFSSCKKTVTVVDSVYNLNDGLVAYYNFNNGTLNDNSGYNNNIIFNNAVKTADRFGNANNAYLFNGTNSYMQVKNNVSLNAGNITLMAIVKLNGFYPGLCHGNQILQKGYSDVTPGTYFLRITDRNTDCSVTADTSKEELGAAFGDIYNAPTNITDAGNYIRTNKWMKIIFTYDGKQSSIYVDGQLKTAVKGNVVFTSNGNDLFIGRSESSQYPYWFNGVIDEIRIYNRALNTASISALNALKN